MLSKRKGEILNLIVGDYIERAAPIASEAIARRHELGVSPATIRNDVAELEEEGYITRPHSSAGTVPLEKGYRLYVETGVAKHAGPIPAAQQSTIRQRLVDIHLDIDDWAGVAAAALAGLVHNMAIVTFPRAPETRVRQLEVVRLQDLLVLLIVVFQETRLRRQLVRLSAPVDAPGLQESANRINEVVSGRTWKEIESKEAELSPLEEELIETTDLMLREEDAADVREHYVDGLRNLLSQPEFSENEMVRPVVEAVEDGTLAQAILDELPEAPVVRVVIGQENRGNLLWPLSVVIGQYGIPGQVSGAVGAIGPVRMAYARAIPGVRFMSDLMSEMVESVQGG